MIKWLKQLFCIHDWKCTDGFADRYNVRFKCSKCDKVEGL